MKKGAVIAIIIILVIAIISIVGIGFLAINYINNKSASNKIITESGRSNNTNLDDKGMRIEDKKESPKDIKLIALLGIDNKSSENSPNTSNAIVIARVNTKTKIIDLVSINKDSFANIKENEYGKITNVYKYNNPELALKTINNYLDLEITDYIVISNEALVKIIDAINGIDIEITAQELQYFNAMLKAEGINNTISKEGTYTLNGNQVLAYSKIRYSSAENEGKPDRIEKILISALNKAQNSKITQLANLVKVLFPQIKTNIPITELLKYVPYAKSFRINKSIVWPYETKFYSEDITYVVPTNLEENVNKLHKEFFKEDNYNSSNKIKEYSKEIEEKTN